MTESNQSPLQTIMEQMMRELGPGFSEAMVLEYVAKQRGRPLRVETDDLPEGARGYAVMLADCDLVVTAAATEGQHATLDRMHLVSHLLLGHVQPFRERDGIKVCWRQGCTVTEAA